MLKPMYSKNHHIIDKNKISSKKQKQTNKKNQNITVEK